MTNNKETPFLTHHHDATTASSNTQITMKRQVFRFLDLPAELRNYIYELIRDCAPAKLTHNRRALRRRNKIDQAQTFFQLAHVNRQIRQEFLLVYHQSITMHIRFIDVPEFMRDFLSPNKVQVTSGSITLDLTGITEDVKGEVDLYPLLKFVKSRPQVTLKAKCNAIYKNFESMYGEISNTRVATPPLEVTRLQTLLDDVIALPPNPKLMSPLKSWSKYFDRYIKELHVTPSRLPLVRVVVKHTATEWWMGSAQKDEKTYEWAEKVGFPRKERKYIVEGS